MEDSNDSTVTIFRITLPDLDQLQFATPGEPGKNVHRFTVKTGLELQLTSSIPFWLHAFQKNPPPCGTGRKLPPLNASIPFEIIPGDGSEQGSGATKSYHSVPVHKDLTKLYVRLKKGVPGLSGNYRFNVFFPKYGTDYDPQMDVEC
jgi:hypothetical protein